MRAAIILVAVVSITSPARAEHVPTVAGEVLTTTGFSEIRGSALVVGTRYVDVECARFDHLSTDTDIRGSFLGAAIRIERAGWSAWFGTHVFSAWTDSYRYLTPSAGLRIGTAELVVRSTGLFATAIEKPPARSVTRDFDLDARMVRGAFEVRGRLRDIDQGETHFRDLFVGVGYATAMLRSGHASVPAFLGIGVRRELWRDAADVRERAVEEVAAPGPGWQGLVWLEVALAIERVH